MNRSLTSQQSPRGKELGKCTHQRTTDDEKNTNERFRHSASSSGKRRQTDNNKKKKEAEKRTDEKEATTLDQRKPTWNSFDPVWLPPSRLSSSLILSSFCRCLSFFFYLTKTPVSKTLVCIFLIVCRPLVSTFSKFFSSRVYLTSSYSLFL